MGQRGRCVSRGDVYHVSPFPAEHTVLLHRAPQTQNVRATRLGGSGSYQSKYRVSTLWKLPAATEHWQNVQASRSDAVTVWLVFYSGRFHRRGKNEMSGLGSPPRVLHGGQVISVNKLRSWRQVVEKQPHLCSVSHATCLLTLPAPFWMPEGQGLALTIFEPSSLPRSPTAILGVSC